MYGLFWNGLKRQIMNKLKPGDCYKNKDPYPGEGEIMITNERQGDNVLVIHCKCEKYPDLNGGREWKPVYVILQSYEKQI